MYKQNMGGQQSEYESNLELCGSLLIQVGH